MKKIIVFSLIGTGIGGLLHLLPLGFTGLLCIYALWGVSTTSVSYTHLDVYKRQVCCPGAITWEEIQ